MAPLARDVGVAYAARLAGRFRGGRRCRCSMWITRCGSVSIWVSWPIPTVVIAEQVGYWEQVLAGLPERLELPTDRPYPPVADFRGASVEVAWPAQLQQQVARVAREHNATSFMVVQAALAVLLAQARVPVRMWRWAFRSLGDGDPALDELVGFFVNTLVLRVDLDGDPTVGELVEQVRQRSLARLRASGRAVRGAGGSAQPDAQP